MMSVAPISQRPTTWRDFVVAMRPQQWIKNVVVVAPLLASGHFKDSSAIALTATTIIAMSLMASAGYLVNDVHDRAHDLVDPIKRRRPIAAGQISPVHAL